MRTRFALPLVLLTLAPLGLLAWLGVLLASQEREAGTQRIIDILRNDLREIAGRIDQQLEEREREMLASIEDYIAGEVPLSSLDSGKSFLSETFLLGPDRKLIYPQPGGGHDDFLNRTETLWEDSSLFSLSSEQIESQEVIARAGRIVGREEAFGWQTWFWNRGQRFLFWKSLPDGGVIGFEVNRSRLVADLIEELPDTAANNEAIESKLYSLVDSQGTILYQWGSGTSNPDSEPTAEQELDPPLLGWSLTLDVPPGYMEAEGISRSTLSLWFGLLAVGLGLLAVGIFAVREYTREIREAEQRVTFVNQVSHELKTPLTNIRMYAELLGKEIPEDLPHLGAKTGVIIEESGRLSRLIGNILTFSRNERSTLKIRLSRGSLDEVVKSTLAQYRPSLEAKMTAVNLDLRVPEEVQFDVDAIGQIVGNLLSNIEKYCPPKSSVSLTTNQQGEMATVVIRDDGPGIPRSERERIFLPFYRISNKLTDGITGTGIGLTISRDLARLHGGDLVLLQTEKGTAFQLTFRFKPPQEEQKL